MTANPQASFSYRLSVNCSTRTVFSAFLISALLSTASYAGNQDPLSLNEQAKTSALVESVLPSLRTQTATKPNQQRCQCGATGTKSDVFEQAKTGNLTHMRQQKIIKHFCCLSVWRGCQRVLC